MPFLVVLHLLLHNELIVENATGPFALLLSFAKKMLVFLSRLWDSVKGILELIVICSTPEYVMVSR